jgi:hypothetical protein
MSVLNHATGAERERGLSWASDFPNAGTIANDGGTLTGTPTFNQGIELDGSNDYITYNNVVGKFNSATVSIVVSFTPEFALDDGANHYIFSSTSEDYRLYKTTANLLQLTLGNTLIANVNVDATWNASQENILVISGTTGNTSMWLNGTKVLTADASAWTPVDVTEFYVGAASNGAAKFQGKVHSIKVFKAQLTDDEAEDFSIHSTYHYMSSCVLNTPLDIATYDPTNTRALDLSGNDYHCSFNYTPVKNKHSGGYRFTGAAGSDQPYLESTSNLGITGAMTVSAWVKATTPPAGEGRMVASVYDYNAGSDNGWRLGDGFGADDHFSFDVWNAGSSATANYNSFFTHYINQWVHITGVYIPSESVTLYANGVQLDQDTSSVPAAMALPDTETFRIGLRSDEASSPFDTGAWAGDIALVKVFDVALTPLQVHDLHLKELSEVSKL